MDSNNNGGPAGDDNILPTEGSAQHSAYSSNNGILASGQGIDFDMQIKSLPAEANDVDLIEKEWVIHLKHIVDQTVGNPYRQQLEISLAKADYLKKRYGKEIKANAG